MVDNDRIIIISIMVYSLWFLIYSSACVVFAMNIHGLDMYDNVSLRDVYLDPAIFKL